MDVTKTYVQKETPKYQKLLEGMLVSLLFNILEHNRIAERNTLKQQAKTNVLQAVIALREKTGLNYS